MSVPANRAGPGDHASSCSGVLPPQHSPPNAAARQADSRSGRADSPVWSWRTQLRTGGVVAGLAKCLASNPIRHNGRRNAFAPLEAARDDPASGKHVAFSLLQRVTEVVRHLQKFQHLSPDSP